LIPLGSVIFEKRKPVSNHIKLKAKIAALERQAEVARSKEKAEVVAKIRVLMADFDITVNDLGALTKATRKTKGTRTPPKPKYRDPKSGSTWSGMGKPPQWIALAIKRGRKDDFLIGASALVSAAIKPKATVKRTTVKAPPMKATAKKVTPAAKKSAVKIAKKAPIKKPTNGAKAAPPKPVKKVAAKKSKSVRTARKAAAAPTETATQ